MEKRPQLLASPLLPRAYKGGKSKERAARQGAEKALKAQQERQRDNELVERIVKGEWSCFDMLVNLYEGPLYGFVLGRRVDEEKAVDITQESFIKAFKSIEDFQPEKASFKTWLFTIAYNLIRDKARRASVRARELKRAKSELDERLRQHVKGPEELCVNRDCVQRLMELLDEESRNIVKMKFYSELSYDQIATITGMNTPSVRCKLHRALKKLRSLVGAEEVRAS
mgnify:CR=1 FL=1